MSIIFVMQGKCLFWDISRPVDTNMFLIVHFDIADITESLFQIYK